MLRRRLRRTTASTGVALTVTHGLGVIPSIYFYTPLSDRGVGRTYLPPANILTNTLVVVNSVQTTVTLDIFVLSFKGELY